MAGTTVLDKISVPHVHHFSWAQLRLLRRESHPQKGPPHHYDPKTIPLHALPPARRRLYLHVRLSAAVGAIPFLHCHSPNPVPPALACPWGDVPPARGRGRAGP